MLRFHMILVLVMLVHWTSLIATSLNAFDFECVEREPTTKLDWATFVYKEKPAAHSNKRLAHGEPAIVEGHTCGQNSILDEARPWNYRPDNKITFVRLFNGRHYENLYPRLSHILEQSLANDEDVEANMRQAREWLEIELERGIDYGNEARVGALEQLLELVKLDEPRTRCSLKAYEILYKNHRATQNRAQTRPSKLRPLTRLDKLIHSVTRRHSLACLDVYPTRYSERCSRMPQAIKMVGAFLDKLAGCEGCLPNELPDLRQKRASESAFEVIKDSARNDIEWTRMSASRSAQCEPGNVRALVRRHVIEPCEQFVRQVGLDIYVPASYSMQVLEGNERYRLDEPRHRDFLLGYARYRLCESLIRHHQGTLMRGVVERCQLAARRGELSAGV